VVILRPGSPQKLEKVPRSISPEDARDAVEQGLGTLAKVGYVRLSRGFPRLLPQGPVGSQLVDARRIAPAKFGFKHRK
jgi:hypothetical protein